MSGRGTSSFGGDKDKKKIPDKKSATKNTPTTPKNSAQGGVTGSPVTKKSESKKPVPHLKTGKELKVTGKPDKDVEGASGGQNLDVSVVKDPPTPNRRLTVESGTFQKRGASPFKPVAVRPELSPRSKKVQDSAREFITVKRRECDEQKYMETCVMDVFPKLQRELREVHDLTQRASALPATPPIGDDAIREENDALNLLICSASSLFKKFDQHLNEVRKKATEFMAKAEAGSQEIDNKLKVVISDIVRYGEPEGGAAGGPPGDKPDDEDKGSKKDGGERKEGADEDEKKDGGELGGKDSDPKDVKDTKGELTGVKPVEELYANASESEPESADNDDVDSDDICLARKLDSSTNELSKLVSFGAGVFASDDAALKQPGKIQEVNKELSVLATSAIVSSKDLLESAGCNSEELKMWQEKADEIQRLIVAIQSCEKVIPSKGEEITDETDVTDEKNIPINK